jgi:cysteine desulfurase
MIYCDHNASTPLRPEALAAMLPYLREHYGNASSVHALGARARDAVETARQQVAALLGARPAEIVFTSGGTESNSLAILGALRMTRRRTVVTTPIEHSSVREVVRGLQDEGYRVREIPVDTAGRIDTAALAAQLDDDVGLASIGWANNEIGTIQPIAEISALCRARDVRLHVDAVQAVGKLPVQIRGIDLLSLSAHKLGGPKGVGALFVQREVPLRPLFAGGAQERGRRAGTENVAGIVGIGVACGLAAAELGRFGEACVALREALWAGLQARIPGICRNSPAGGDCLPNTLNVSVDGVRGEALVAALDLAGVAVSSGSACAAGAGEASHVLLAVGRDPDAARDGVRFSLGRSNTNEDIEPIVAHTAAAAQRIRAIRRGAPADA